MSAKNFNELGFKKKFFHMNPSQAKILNAQIFQILRESAQFNTERVQTKSPGKPTTTPTVGSGVIATDDEVQQILSYSEAELKSKFISEGKILPDNVGNLIDEQSTKNPDDPYVEGQLLTFDELYNKRGDKMFSFKKYFEQFVIAITTHTYSKARSCKCSKEN